ncbi:MAG TPA: hypothetical protein VFM31_03825 [Nitrososphaeraceae archaeon]|nr:hypothetical protein [Nitrososphaeraceae archaeon]
MHKSILMFLGLLTFLIPVGPSMSNINAMAFDDYGYDADQYEKYANGMANNNYYKSQGSDVVKKIKCNNINANFNGVEANIGTADPLGVGAASLQDDDDPSASWFGNGQRNNGNFDLDCINNNNNVGGQGGNGTGQQGPRGPVGPQGPAGLSTINTTNIYTVVGDPVSIDSNDFGSSVAVCDLNDTALSGSFETEFLGGIGTIATMVSSKPLANETGWNATALQNSSGNSAITADVVCFDNAEPHEEVAVADVSTFKQSEDEVIMSQGIGDSTTMSQGIKDSPVMSQGTGDLSSQEQLLNLNQQWLSQLP